MSTPRASTSTGTDPIAWTASVWNRTPRSRQAFAHSAIGSSVPISLFAAMIETRIVLSVIASASAPGLTRPNSSTGR